MNSQGLIMIQNVCIYHIHPQHKVWDETPDQLKVVGGTESLLSSLEKKQVNKHQREEKQKGCFAYLLGSAIRPASLWC